MKKKYQIITILVSILAMVLAGCGNTSKKASENATPIATPLVTEQAKDKAILVVSFGTSYNDSREVTIGAIEKAIKQEFSDYEVRRAFTSQIIIDKLAKRDNLKIDNVTEALDRAVADGIKTLIVQPTHLMNGYEYTDLANELKKYTDKFTKVTLAEPLLTSDEDFNEVIKSITYNTLKYDDGKTAICFMGHGTQAESNGVYAKLQKMLTAAGHKNYFIGTVEATPTVDDLIKKAKQGGYKKVVLEPLMVVAGDHANNDMAGDEKDSWKSKFKAAGFEVECVLKGLGEFADIQSIYVNHTKAATKEASGSGTEEIKSVVHGTDLKDGTYPIDVTSSSSMFKIVDAKLMVASGKMSVVMTLSGTGYSHLFMGTAEEGDKASKDKFIHFVEDTQGKYTYTVPVEALNEDTDCAAWSIKKKKFYDRTLVFESGKLPEDAFVTK